ncbi:MAG: MFS transporter [Betaproteobacteria bacterium]|nr:MFS transporter [Betaproteobacteria bacterium]
MTRPEPTGPRAMAVLALAGFFSAAAFRICDPLLPQLATEFATTTGAAAYTITVFAVAYGLLQIVWGPLGDRFGKFRTAGIATLACAVGNIGAVFADSLTALIVCRFIAGATGGGIVPLALAWIGDTVLYAQRQAALARFLTSTILGVACGQFIGGLIADTLGWRWAFGLLACGYIVSGILMQLESRRAVAPAGGMHAARTALPRPPFRAQVAALLRDRWVRVVLVTVALEGAIFTGALTFVPAALHDRFGLSLTAAGATAAAFGLGAVAYTLAARRLVAGLGERGLAQGGAVVLLLAFAGLWLAPGWEVVLVGCLLSGFGFYMLHNTLQTNATQMAPAMRGTSLALFASCFFIGQSAGVALAAQVVDYSGSAVLFMSAMILMPLVALGFARALRTRPAHHFS